MGVRHMNEVITFVKRSYGASDQLRQVFCSLRSIGMREFYQASATDFHPEAKFVLADYLEYCGETLLIHGDTWYKILRTYRAGQELELVVEKASKEEASVRG